MNSQTPSDARTMNLSSAPISNAITSKENKTNTLQKIKKKMHKGRFKKDLWLLF